MAKAQRIKTHGGHPSVGSYEIREIETIAAGQSVRIRRRLERIYGKGRWRKMKGVAVVELADGTMCEAEIHWYEAHGIGRKEFKIKRVIPHRSLISGQVSEIAPISLSDTGSMGYKCPNLPFQYEKDGLFAPSLQHWDEYIKDPSKILNNTVLASASIYRGNPGKSRIYRGRAKFRKPLEK